MFLLRSTLRLLMNQFSDLSSILAVLSSMITPAVLISACGSLTISTSNRLSRAMDRTRLLAKEFSQLVQSTDETRDQQRRLSSQLGSAAARARLLHRALTTLYLALSAFIGSSVAIGALSISHAAYSWIPLVFGLIGVMLLFHSSLLLISETRIARAAINEEIAATLQLGQQHFE
jgi:hypothetical protein